jgi:hypothetical protein
VLTSLQHVILVSHDGESKESGMFRWLVFGYIRSSATSLSSL